jgi:hypothetical protein
MRKTVLILLLIAAAWLAAAFWLHLTCERHESAFQAKFEELRREAHEELKVGTTREEALGFFARNHLQATSTQSKIFGSITLSRGCARGLGCSIGPDGGLIHLEVSLDEQGRVNAEPLIREKYIGDCV